MTGKRYVLAVFESMAGIHEGFLKERAGPMVIRNQDGYVHVSNGPRTYALCDGYPCLERPAAYYAPVVVGMSS